MLICLLGATCAGKDTILNDIFNGERKVQMKDDISNSTFTLERFPIYTTRPRRPDEGDDVYYFLDSPCCFSNAEKTFLVNGNRMKWNSNPPLESRSYTTIEGDWEYGTLPPTMVNILGEKIEMYDLTKNNYIVACSATQLTKYLKVINSKYIAIIYLPISRKEQYKRYFNRLMKGDKLATEDLYEMIRRIDADFMDYRNVASWLGNLDGLFSFTSIPNANTKDVINEIVYFNNLAIRAK